MAKILVLGGFGQLGSDIVQVLQSHNHTILTYHSYELDALGQNFIDVLEKHLDCDYVINCIAMTNVDLCEDEVDRAFLLNGTTVVKLSKFCDKHNITLIHISTDYVFDGTKTSPYTEEDMPNPINIYGLSKYIGDMAIIMHSRKFFIFRVSSLFGARGASGKGGNFVTTMLKLAKNNKPFNVINDQITCPTHTLDVAKAIAHFINQKIDQYGIYNCVSSTSCSWFEFACKIFTFADKNLSIINSVSHKSYNFRTKRPKTTTLLVNKISTYYTMPEYQYALKEYMSLNCCIEP